MTWLKVDDKLHAHPKWTRCTAEAKALWTTAGAWSASYRTDGVLKAHDLAVLAPQVGLTLAKVKRAAANLVENDMWRVFEDGWVFHNWTDFNPTRNQQKISEEVERERRAIQHDDVLKAAVRLRDHDRCCFCDEPVNFAARTGQLAGRYDHTVPLSKGGKTSLANVRVCCNYHNQQKAGKVLADLPHDFPPLLEPWTVRHPADARLSQDLVLAESALVGDSGRDGSGRVRPNRAEPGRGAGPSSESIPPPDDSHFTEGDAA